MQFAARQGDLVVCQLLVARGLSVRHRDRNGNTALHFAANGPIASLLISHGAGLTEPNKEGATPLHIAISPEVARLLLVKGVPVDVRDKAGHTPLLYAVAEFVPEFTAHPEIAKVLVSSGADVNASGIINGKSILQWAVKDNDADLVHRLLDRGAKVNINSPESPLLIASSNGIMEGPDGYGNGISADRGPTTIARLLLDRGADINACARDQKTALIRAALSGDDIMVALLLKRGAEREVQDAFGYSALHWAAWNWHPRVVRLLIAHGANIQVVNREGKTPLDLARAAAALPPANQEKPNPVDLLSDALARSPKN